jgi:hypothetical protein
MAELKTLSRETFDDLLAKVLFLKANGSRLDITDTYYFKESVSEMLGSCNFSKCVSSSWENGALLQFLASLLPMGTVKEVSAIHPLFAKILDVTHCYGEFAKTYSLEGGEQDSSEKGEFLKWLLFGANKNNNPSSNRNFFLFKDEYPAVLRVLSMFKWNRMVVYKPNSGNSPTELTYQEFEEFQTTYLLRILFQYGLADGLVFIDAISEAKAIATEKGWFVPATEIPA